MWSSPARRHRLAVVLTTLVGPLLLAGCDPEPSEPAPLTDEGCTVTFAQADKTSEIELPEEKSLDFPTVVTSHLSFKTAADVAVDVGESCPVGLVVSPAEVRGEGTYAGEAASPTMRLGPRTTHIAMTWQPCAQPSGGTCRGPQELVLYSVSLAP